ncbi:MAG TPA: diguanylate cyclase, partial [Noviherbaspirillum sp.]
YAWTGSVSWSIALAYLALNGGSALLFRLMIVLNWNLRIKDKGLLMPQMITALLLHIGFLALAPQLAFVFLASILVFYNFAMISFDVRRFSAAWLFCGAATATALYIGRERFGYPGTSAADMAILWLFFFLAIQRLTTIGLQFSRLREKLSEKNHALQEALSKNEEMARRDDLTGSHNRRYFMQALDQERERASRTGQLFCVAIFDLDHFKLINDQYGHLVGDEVLRIFVRLVHQTLRTTDCFARYGGEEFVLMMVATARLDLARIPVERIRRVVEEYDWEAVAQGLKVTVSSGTAAYHFGESAEELLGRADAALYDAKHAGRNCNRMEQDSPSAMHAPAQELAARPE